MAEVMGPQELLARCVPQILARHEQAWLVGGWVRDRLRGELTHDIDFVVPAGAVATARYLADWLGGSFVLLDQERDTARVLVGPAWEETYLDLAGLRAPRIEDDLLERDFTVNAMAVPASDWQGPQLSVIDPTGGRRDLERGLLRAVSSESYRADPLRLMRAVRLSGSLGLELERDSRTWAQRDAALLATVAHERVRDELVQIVDLTGAERWCRLLEDLGLLAVILPEIERLRGVVLPEAGYDALEQGLMTLAAVDTFSQLFEGRFMWSAAGWPFEFLGARLAPYAQRLAAHLRAYLPGAHRAGSLLRLAALLHNTGRGTVPAPAGRLLDRETLSASVAATVMRRLCFSGAETTRVRETVRNSRRPWQLAEAGQGQVPRREAYRFYRESGSGGVDAVLLSFADHLASADQQPEREHWERHVAAGVQLLHAYYEQYDQVVAPPPLVDGHDLMATLNLAEGPELGALLDSLRELQAAGEIDSREQALVAARRWLEHGSPS